MNMDNIKPMDMDTFLVDGSNINSKLKYEIKKQGKDEIYIYKDKDNNIVGEITINWSTPFIAIDFNAENPYILQTQEATELLDKINEYWEKNDVNLGKAIYKVINLEGY